jgi:hypothetical protein
VAGIMTKAHPKILPPTLNMSINQLKVGDFNRQATIYGALPQFFTYT